MPAASDVLPPRSKTVAPTPRTELLMQEVRRIDVEKRSFVAV
jgi:hypothetical protein